MRVQDAIFAVGMLVAGTINTISSKLQDEVTTVGLPGSEPRKFAHPAVQTLTMFMGESLCMLVYFIVRARSRKAEIESDGSAKPNRSYPLWTFLLPAMCDMTGSTLMYVGLLMTYPSVYQMLRGMIVVFTGIFSYLFLGTKLRGNHIIGMLLIVIGTVLVGVSSVMSSKHSKDKASHPLIGDLLVVAAQIVAATQMVLEEKFIGKYNVHPLQVVGNEGVWGMAVTTVILIVGYFILPIRHVDNSLDAAYQIKNSHELLGALLLSIFSIAFLNFFGISVTKYLSATHRTTIDATRVVLVWVVSLIVHWEQFQWLQLVGFLVLMSGTSIFNEIVRLPFLRYPPKETPPASVAINTMDEEKQKLID